MTMVASRRSSSSSVFFCFGMILITAEIVVPGVHAMRLDFTLPGFGNKISYRDGIIRIQQKQQPTTIKDGNNSNNSNNNNNDDANDEESKCFVIPNDAWKSILRSSFEEENSSLSPSPSSSSSSSSSSVHSFDEGSM